jgi:hypothetical protein
MTARDFVLPTLVTATLKRFSHVANQPHNVANQA